MTLARRDRLIMSEYRGEQEAGVLQAPAEDGIVNVVNTRWLYRSCTKGPGHDVEGSEKPAYCRRQAEDGTVIALNRRCLHGPDGITMGCVLPVCSSQ